MISKASAIELLNELCDQIHRAEILAQDEYKRETFGDDYVELSFKVKNKILVEIRNEKVRHNKPHMHITHSDQIDVSICLETFEVLAGHIKNKTKKTVLEILKPKQKKLLEIWNELNEKDNSIMAQKLISDLFL